MKNHLKTQLLGYSTAMLRGLGFLFFVMLMMASHPHYVHGEGSGTWGTDPNRQSMLWVPGSGTGVSSLAVRGSMMVPTGTTGYNPGHRLYVYVRNGETVFWGFRGVFTNNTTIRVRWFYDANSSGFYPQGTAGASRTQHSSFDYVSNAAGGAEARPADAMAAHLGPSQITGQGYLGRSFTNNTGADRAFWVEISNTSNTIIGGGFNINFWDITVASGSPGSYVEQTGRVYCRFWSVANSRANITVNNLTIVEKGQPDAYSFHEDFGFFVPIDNTFTSDTDDYFVKRIRFPGSSGGWTNFFANQDGPRNTLSFEENRRSIETTSTNAFQYPLFLNDPDPSIWRTTTPPSATLDIVYREKTPPATGGEANVNISIDLPAIVDILIDVNGNEEYDPATDILISQIYESPGDYTIYWNGQDASGVELPSGGELKFIATVAFFPVHFPIYDLEQCLGILVDNVRPGDPERDFIFWDDSLIPRTGITPSDSPQSIPVNVTGVLSPDHIWWATGDNGFSNNKTINTWTASSFSIVRRISGFTFLTISGNVLEDLDRNGIVEGEGVDLANLYAVLVDEFGNVVSFATVQSDGSFTIIDVPNGEFSILLTTEVPVNGMLAPPVILPNFYESTEEFLGTGSGTDGIPNSILTNIEVNNVSITDANFGIRPIDYDLIALKSVDNNRPEVGDLIEFLIIVENRGRSDITQVFLDELMPTGYKYISHTADRGIFDPLSDPMRWDIGMMASNDIIELSIIVEVLADGEFTNTVNVYSTTGIPDSNPNNNEATEETIIQLPVTWLHFHGRAHEKRVALEWATVQEKNNDFFGVMRSSNGRDWQEISRIKAVGTTQDISFYQTWDDNPIRGMNFYRIRQQDEDGQASYTQVIRIDFVGEDNLSIYPNPHAHSFTVEFADLAQYDISLLDAMGKPVFIQLIDRQQHAAKISTEHLPKGIYFLRISSAGFLKVRKLVKGN
ncbi:MAG: T9SS type A sorting domain-containing protein [Mongoliitalea sp.]